MSIKDKPKGFASFAGTRRHLKLSSKGGSRKVRKGFATLSPEDRSKRAREASKIRWEKARQIKQEQGKPVNREIGTAGLGEDYTRA